MLRLLRAIFPEPQPDRSFEEALAQRRLERTREEVMAALGKGRWVARADMHPLTNVADRLYRTADGSVHRAIFFPLPHRADAWFFPDQ